MSKLHITNGDSLTDYLKEIDITDDIITWREMLCEGPTIPAIASDSFFEIRASFLKESYNINTKDYDFKNELQRLDAIDDIEEINLWFEYDLFCHINMLGAINYLHQKEINKPLYLICSGRIKGEKQLKGLAELTPEQLRLHYEQKIRLTEDDIKLAIALWRTYCGKDHNILKPYIVKSSNFKYLSNCLKAHLVRFPNQKTGLSRIEENILNLINEKQIKSKHHLLGYILNYQGYYGFGDIQLSRIIDKLDSFFEEHNAYLRLTRAGHEALLGEFNCAKTINNNMVYGGVRRLDFQFSTEKNMLIKTIANVN